MDAVCEWLGEGLVAVGVGDGLRGVGVAVAEVVADGDALGRGVAVRLGVGDGESVGVGFGGFRPSVDAEPPGFCPVEAALSRTTETREVADPENRLGIVRTRYRPIFRALNRYVSSWPFVRNRSIRFQARASRFSRTPR